MYWYDETYIDNNGVKWYCYKYFTVISSTEEKDKQELVVQLVDATDEPSFLEHYHSHVKL